jgi:hypothetical protein
MSLPEIEQHRVGKLFKAFIEKRVPVHVRDQVKLVCKVVGNRVTCLNVDLTITTPPLGARCQ